MKMFLSVAVVCCIANTLLANADQRTFSFVDLQPWGNRKLSDDQGGGRPGTDLNSLPVGSRFFGDVKFKVEEKLIQLGSTILDDLPEKAEAIEVNLPVAKLHFLHATCFGGGPNEEGSDGFVKDGTLIGEYRVNFEDRTAIIMPIVYGEDVRDWFYVEGEKAPNRGKVVWEGNNQLASDVAKGIRLYSSSWENPWPKKRVTSIDYSSKMDDTVAAPFCVAITVEGKKDP